MPPTLPRRLDEVADDVAHEVLGRDDLDLHDGLEQDGLGLAGAPP